MHLSRLTPTVGIGVVRNRSAITTQKTRNVNCCRVEHKKRILPIRSLSMQNTSGVPTGFFRGYTEMGVPMSKKSLPIIIVVLTVILIAAAIEFLPATLYFPVVEYSTPGNIHFVLLKNGEPDKSSCKKSVSQVAGAVRASCADCKYVERCLQGLDDERKKILSREPLATPSLRTQDGRLTMTVSAADPEVAMSVCRLAAEQTASQTADRRLLCSPASAPR